MKKISFQLSKNGTRYHPKPKPNPSVFVDDEVDDASATSSVIKHHQQLVAPARVQCDYDFSKKGSVVDLTEDDNDEDTKEISDEDVSFMVNIFPDGYTIDKSHKSIAAQQIALMYDPKLLRPYDRASQSLFKAIECCRVPANFFEDIPCIYKNGKVACEVRDWRKDSSEQAGVSINRLSVAAIPSIRRVSLKMSVNSIVRDIPEMSKRDFWAYSELLEMEAKILLNLYPKLDLDPYPDFDRLCKKPTTVKLNLDFRAMRRKRLRQMSVPEKSNLGTDQPNVANSSIQNASQRTAMGPPNAVNLATQNVGQIRTTHQLTQNVPCLPTLDQLTQNVRERMHQLTQNVPQLLTLDQLTQNVGQRPAMDPPNVVNLATQNVGQCNMTIPNTSIPRFPWESPQPKDQFGKNQQMTLETLDNTPGTAFNRLRASNTRSMSLPSANDGRRYFTSAFDGRTVNQDGQSSFPMAYLEGRSRSNSFVFIGNNMQNAARTTVNAPGASSSHNGGTSSIIPFHGNKGNQDGHSSSFMKMESGNWSNPLADIFNQHQNTSATAFSAPGASSTHGTMSLNSNNDGISSIIPFDDGKMGNQDVGRSSSVANLDNRNQSNPLAIVGYQQPKIEPHLPDHAQRTAFGVPGASSSHSMIDLTSDELSSFLFGLDDKSGNQDGQSSSMANPDNRNQSNLLAIVGNQQQQIASYMQNDTSSQIGANLPEGFYSQGTVNLSSDDDIDISAILAAIEANDSSPIANNTYNNQSNPLASNGNQPQQQIAANQQHGMVSSGSDNDCLWSAFDNTIVHQDGESSSMAKRNRLNPLAFSSNQTQQMAGSSHMDKNTQQSNAIAPTQKQYRFQMLDAISRKPNIGHQGASYDIKQKPLESDRLHPTFPQQLTRSTFFQAPWNNKSPSPVNINVKEEPEFSSGLGSSSRRSVFASVPIDIITIEDDEHVQRRSSSRPPKSGEFSSEATRRQNRAAARSSSQTERSVVNSVPVVGGSRSSSSNANNSMHPTQMAETPGSKPHLTIPILHGIGFSSTIGNTGGLSVASTSVQRELDRRTQDRFTKIELLTARYKLNCKELKVDDYNPTKNIPSSQLNHALMSSNDNHTLIDETCKMPLSMSHAGGNVNLCKTRILKFVKEAHSYHAGNEEILVPRSETKLILSERQSDGTVTMHYCEFDDYDHSAEQELLPTFSNTHTADLFAAEFCSLMKREGYTVAGDYLQANPASVIQFRDGQHKRAIGPAVIVAKPYPVGTSKASCSSSTHNVYINAEGGGFSVPSPTSPITDGNVVGTGLNIGGGNSLVGSQGFGNVRRGANLQVPSGSGSGSRGWGSRGRGSRGRGSRGQGSRGQGSDITPDNNVNPSQRNVLPLRMALSATNQGGASNSKNWTDDEFMRNLMK